MGQEFNGGQSYDVKQAAGNLTYWNRRLLSRSATGVYRSPTHEYLDVPTAGQINGIWFKDHADGSNRPDKFKRDIALLEKVLRTETNEGLLQRRIFTLASHTLTLATGKGGGPLSQSHRYGRVRRGSVECPAPVCPLS